jgi:hypothetical protein
VTNLEMTQSDLSQIEKYIQQHEARIEIFGKKEYSGRIFSDLDPKIILPTLYRLRDELLIEIKKLKSKKKNEKSKR